MLLDRRACASSHLHAATWIASTITETRPPHPSWHNRCSPLRKGVTHIFVRRFSAWEKPPFVTLKATE
jgi:hypothetical protein